MEKISREPKILRGAAVFGQLASLFPFAVIFEGIGTGKFTVWHYFAAYGVWSVFYASGFLFSKLYCGLENGNKLPKKALPFAVFVSRAAVAVPSAVFIAACAALNITPAVYFYIFPACVIAYFNAHTSVGKSYSDVLSKGNFVLYFIMAIADAAIFRFSGNEYLISSGNFQLCAGFAVIIVLSALLANQTNIDVRTKQRSAGKAVLPEGLRRYNAGLIAGICGLTIGMFVFAKPIGALLKAIVGVIVQAVLFLLSALSNCVPEYEEPVSPPSENAEIADSASVEMPPINDWAPFINAALIIALAVFIFINRKSILEYFKELLMPLFQKRDKTFDTPYMDEISMSGANYLDSRARRKAEREIQKRYRKASAPDVKYRLGYSLFLIRLAKTSTPPEPSDTTTVHCRKGGSVWDMDLNEFCGEYNKVRYGELSPDNDEILKQERILKRLK